MIDSNRRKDLVFKRFGPIIKQILTWPDETYSEIRLFKHLVIILNSSKNELVDQLGSQILSEDIPCFSEYQMLIADIDCNFNEYREILKCLIDQEINNNFIKFIKYWNDIDKYLILMD